MLDGTDPRVSVRQLPGICLRVRDQLRDRPDWHCRMDSDTENIGGHARDRIQVLDWVVERPALEQDLVDVGLRASEQDRVAVRTGARDSGGPQGRATPADILNDHSAE